MGLHCAAFGCKNNSDKKIEGIRFHRFPMSKPELCHKWTVAVRRESWQPTKYSVICNNHFLEDDYKPFYQDGRHELKDGVVPSVFSNYPPHPLKTSKKRHAIIKSDNPPKKKVSSMIVQQETSECDLQTQTTLSSAIAISELNTSSSKSNAAPSSVLSNTAATPLTVTRSKVRIPDPIVAVSSPNAVSTNAFAASTSAKFVSTTCSDTSSVWSNATATSLNVTCSKVRIPDSNVASPYSKVASTKSIGCLPCLNYANSVVDLTSTSIVTPASAKAASTYSIAALPYHKVVDLNNSKSCSSSSSMWPSTEETCLNCSQANILNLTVDSPSSKVASAKAAVASTCSDVASANYDAEPLPFTISKSACSNVSSTPASTSGEPVHSNVLHYSYLFYKASFKKREMLYKDENCNRLRAVKSLQQKRRRLRKKLNRLFSVVKALRVSGALKKELYNVIEKDYCLYDKSIESERVKHDIT